MEKKIGSIDLDIMIDDIVSDHMALAVSDVVDSRLNRIEKELKLTQISALLIGTGTLLWMLKSKGGSN